MDISKSQIIKICTVLKFDFENITVLGRGAFNVNYLITTKQGKFVLRISNSTHSKNLRNEYYFLEKTNGDFGPKVYFFDESFKIIPKVFLVEEFIETGTHPPAKPTDNFIQTMAEWYNKLNQIKSDELPSYMSEPQYYSLERAFEWRCEAYHKNKNILTEESLSKLEPIYQQAKKIVDENQALFKNRGLLSINQGDPSRSNIFYQKDSVRLIDWEFVKYDLKEFDLAFFVWSFDLDYNKTKEFLQLTGYSTTSIALKQFEIIYLIHCLMILAWKVERLKQITKGLIDSKLKSSTTEELLKSIQEDLPKIVLSIKRLTIDNF